MNKIAAGCSVGLITLLSLSSVTCTASSNDGIQGTYSDGPGTLILELRSGGKAEITDHGNSEPCTYAVSEKKLSLDCKGDWGKTAFAIHDDQSLTVVGSAFPMPALRKQK
jgi:hypothetical protein